LKGWENATPRRGRWNGTKKKASCFLFLFLLLLLLLLLLLFLLLVVLLFRFLLLLLHFHPRHDSQPRSIVASKLLSRQMHGSRDAQAIDGDGGWGAR